MSATANGLHLSTLEDLRAHIDHSQHAVVVLSLPDLRIVAVNTAGLALTRRSEADVIGRSAPDLWGSNEANSVVALSVLAVGAIDSYTARRNFYVGSEVREMWTWVQRVVLDDGAYAVAITLDAEDAEAAVSLIAEGIDPVRLLGAIRPDDIGRSEAEGSTGWIHPSQRARLERLSPRQRDIVDALLRGERTSTIARRLNVSPSTVRNHLSQVFRVFRVHSQAELVTVLRFGHEHRG